MSRFSHLLRGAMVAALFGLLASCQTDRTVGPSYAGGALFTSYVSLGNSITAGYQSGGINDSTQQRSYAVLLARQFGTRFAIPSLAMPGCAPPISNFNTQARVTPAGFPPSTGASCYLRTQASATDILNNVAVPGAISLDPTSSSTSASNPLTTFILGGMTQVQRALLAKPTFATIWIGNNDVLGPALAGLPGGFPTVQTAATPLAAFVTNYAAMMSQLLAGAPGLKGVLIGVVDVTNAPQLFPAAALQSAAFLGALSAASGTAVTPAADCLTAPGNASLINILITGEIRRGGNSAVSVPIHCIKSPSASRPLDGNLYVLDAAEQAGVVSLVGSYNAYIKAKADSVGFAYLDPNTTVLAALKASGGIVTPPNLASTAAPFGTGITLDGVHPSSSTHILIANQLILAINAKYGTTVSAIQ